MDDLYDRYRDLNPVHYAGLQQEAGSLLAAMVMWAQRQRRDASESSESLIIAAYAAAWNRGWRYREDP